LTGLGSDRPAIARKDLWFEGQGLQRSITQLVSAVADGSDPARARGEFAALFGGSSVPESAIEAAFNDLLQAIKESGLTPDDLATVDALEAGEGGSPSPGGPA